MDYRRLPGMGLLSPGKTLSLIFVGALLFTLGCATPVHLERGDAAMKKKDYKLAIKEYRQAMVAHPKRSKEAERKLGKAESEAAAALFGRAEQARNQEYSLNRALQLYNECIAYNPDHEAARKARSEVKAYIAYLKRKIDKAKAAQKREDWFRAEKTLWNERNYKATFPEIGQIWERVSGESFKVRVAEGKRYFDLQQYERSIEQLKEATRLRPDDGSAKKLLETAENHKVSKDLFYQAIQASDKKQFAKSIELLRESLKKNPKNQRASLFLREATRKGAKTLLQQGESLRDKNKLLDAYKTLLEASSMKSSVTLQKKITDRLNDVKKRIAAKWYLEANSFEQKGLFAAAWVRFNQARIIWPGFANVDLRVKALEKRIQQTLHYRLVVLPATVGKRADEKALFVITKTFLDALKKKLPKKQFTIYPHTQMKNGNVGSFPVSGVLRINLDLYDIIHTAKTEEKSKNYLAAVGVELNPEKKKLYEIMEKAKGEREKALAQWEKTQNELKQKESLLKQAQDELAEFKKNNPPNKSLAPSEKANDPREKKIDELEKKISARQQDLNQYKSNQVPTAKSKLDSTTQAFESAKEKYLQTEVFREKKFNQNYKYTRLTITKKGEVAVKFDLIDLVSKKSRFNETMNFVFQKTDTTQYGFPKAGVVADPLDLPSNKTIDENLVQGILRKGLPPIETALGPIQERFLQAMKESGKTPSLHYAVLAYWARKDLKKEVSKDLVQKILEATGFDIEKKKLVLDKLTL